MPPSAEKASYIGLVRLTDNTVLASVFSKTALSSQKATVERFFLETIQSNKPFEDKWRQKQSLDMLPGNFFLQIEYNFAFGGWLRNGVSDTSAWDFMKEAISLSKEFGTGMNSQGALALNKDLKKPLRDLMDELNDRSDAVGDTQVKIENVQFQMQDNMRKMMGNQQDLESLEESSEEMNRSATMFQTSATSARKQAQRRSMKIKCLAGVVIVSIIAYIIITFTGVPSLSHGGRPYCKLNADCEYGVECIDGRCGGISHIVTPNDEYSTAVPTTSTETTSTVTTITVSSSTTSENDEDEDGGADGEV